MKAIRIEDKRARWVDCEAPTAAPGQVLVNIVASGICGSDLHLMDMGFSEGRIIGHEFAGLTADGTAVAIEPLLSCGGCASCLQGYASHCVESQILGVMVDGGMAETVAVPEHALVRLPAGLNLANASLVEPLAVAEHGLNRVQLQPGEKVLVVGAGPIGLAACAMLAARGVACDVIARHPHQQMAAERLGATLNSAQEYTLVIDAVGLQSSFNESLQRLRPGGRILMLGSPWQPVSFDAGLCMKEANLVTSALYRTHPAPQRDFVTAAQALVDVPAIAECMISHRFPLEAAEEAFAVAGDRSSGAIKVVFEPAV